MIERDRIEQPLMLARTASWAPAAAKARVRANLVASGALPGASATGSARSVVMAKLTTALLVCASFVAGYWLGFQRSLAPHAPEPASAAVAPGLEATAGAALAAAPPHADVKSAEAAGVRGAPREASIAHDPLPARARAPHRATPRPSGAASQRARATPGQARLARAPATSDPMADELLLLSRAERAIRAREPLLARSFLAELDERFPSSTMLEERAAAHLLVECGLSNPAARRRAELFLSDRAASVYTDRVRRACGLERPATKPTSLASGAADGSPKSGH